MIRRTLHALAAIALLAPAARAQQTPAAPPPVRADEESHRPRPIPDRVVLTWTGDPATTQTVTWRTDITVKMGVAQIMTAPEGALEAD